MSRENDNDSNNRVFSDTHFNSNDGIMTGIWGPSLWHTLHCIGSNFPVNPTPEDKKHYASWLMLCGKVLPCRYCRENFPENLRKAGFGPDALRNREAFNKFIYRLHREVNTMLGKKTPLSFRDVQERYEAFRSRCLTDDQKAALERRNLELGCTEALHGQKGKCTISIVPKSSERPTFHVDDKCKIRRSTG